MTPHTASVLRYRPHIDGLRAIAALAVTFCSTKRHESIASGQVMPNSQGPRNGILEPQKLLCAIGKCAVAHNAASLYVDEEHLSALGALVAEPALETLWSAEPSG